MKILKRHKLKSIKLKQLQRVCNGKKRKQVLRNVIEVLKEVVLEARRLKQVGTMWATTMGFSGPQLFFAALK